MKVIEKEALFEMKQPKAELINDNFQNYKRYEIPKAQLVIADIPYNIGRNFYGSNPYFSAYVITVCICSNEQNTIIQGASELLPL